MTAERRASRNRADLNRQRNLATVGVAEGEGFEPSKRYYRLRDFQSRALGQAMRPFHKSGRRGYPDGRRREWDSNPR